MHIIRMSAKGQIFIPARLRDRYGLHNGSRLEIREAEGHLAVYPLPDDPYRDAKEKHIAAFRGSLKNLTPQEETPHVGG